MDLYGQRVKVLLGKDTPNDHIVLERSIVVDEKLTLPKGTRIEKIPTDPYTLAYTLPDGYLLTGTGARQQAVVASAGRITCSCSKGSGCSPFIADLKSKETGCLMGNRCDACEKKSSARLAAPNNSGGEVVESITDVDVIDLNKPIEFLTDRNKIKELACANLALLSNKLVQEKLKEFVGAYQHDNLEEVYAAETIDELPANYEMVAVNLFGRAVLVPIDRSLSPLTANPLNPGYVSRARLAATSCKCESGSIGCTKGSYSVPFLGKVVYCDAGRCKTCSLIN